MVKINNFIYIFIALMCVASVFAAGIFLTSRTLTNSGAVIARGDFIVYNDAQETQVCTVIDWGILDPGMEKNYTVYIRSDATITLEFSMNTEAWNPLIASNYITLTWNREGYWSGAHELFPAVFTLHVFNTVENVTSFSFNIIITSMY